MRKRNLIIVCITAFMLLVLLGSCREKIQSPDAEAWFIDFMTVVNEAKKKGEGASDYLMLHLPDTPVLVKNPEFTDRVNSAAREDLIRKEEVKLDQDIKSDPTHEAELRAQFEEKRNMLSTYNVFVISEGKTVVEDIGLYQDADGKWHPIESA